MSIEDAYELYYDKRINAGELVILICDIKEASQAEKIGKISSYKDDKEKQTVRTLK
jgi:hypothetical protein